MHVPEAPLERTEHGLVRKGEGWFVLNARDARWNSWPGLGHSTNLAGDVMFQQIGIGLTVLGPDEPMSMYHWEADEEDFSSSRARRRSSSKARSESCGNGTSSTARPGLPT